MNFPDLEHLGYDWKNGRMVPRRINFTDHRAAFALYYSGTILTREMRRRLYGWQVNDWPPERFRDTPIDTLLGFTTPPR